MKDINMVYTVVTVQLHYSKTEWDSSLSR